MNKSAADHNTPGKLSYDTNNKTISVKDFHETVEAKWMNCVTSITEIKISVH